MQMLANKFLKHVSLSNAKGRFTLKNARDLFQHPLYNSSIKRTVNMKQIFHRINDSVDKIIIFVNFSSVHEMHILFIIFCDPSC